MHLPKVFAHRGASQIAPENTLIAFEKARQLGATWVEFDVMLTQDEVVIVHHDDTFTRILGLDQNVQQTPYAQIKDKDAGSWFDKKFSDVRIPTLEQTLSCCAKLGLSLNIELKTTQPYAQQTALKTLELLKKVKFFTKENILFSSLEIDALKTVQIQAPEYKRGLVADNWPDVNKALAQLSFDTLSLHYPMLTQQTVTAMRNQGHEILAFTVNDRALAMELFAMGVESVFSDNTVLLD
jgi:glycerophosphoryl diester phosphodiesterase